MDFGGHPYTLEHLVDYTKTAARSGFTVLSANDHLVFSVPWLDGPTALAVTMEHSGRMTLATTVTLAVVRGPVPVAKTLGAIDRLSGGRTLVVVGPGSSPADYASVGLDFEQRWARLDEAVQALRALWRPGSAPFVGRFYSTEGMRLEPAPARPGGPPIWLGSWGSDAGLRRVARLADGWLSSAGPGHQSPEQFAEDVKRLNAFLVQEGKDPATFPNAVSTMALFISEDKEELARIGGPGFVPRPTGVGVVQPAERPGDDAHAHDMVGTRAVCLDKVRRWQAAGAQALFLVPRGPDPLGQMRLFLHEVASQA